MASKFSSGKHSIADCDRCGQRYKLKELKIQILKTKPYNIKVCRTCWEPDHPQLRVGMYPVNDPQAVREPRPDTGRIQGGLVATGYPSEGNRVFQWGWNPVGGGVGNAVQDTPNDLICRGQVGTVTITTT